MPYDSYSVNVDSAIKLLRNIKKFNRLSHVFLFKTGIAAAGSFPLPLNTNISASSRNGDHLNVNFTTGPGNLAPIPVPVLIFDSNGQIIVKYRLIWEMLGTYNVDGKIKGKPVSYTADGIMEYVSGGSILPTQKP